MILAIITALLSVLLAWTYLKNRGLDHGEYYVLLLFSVAGAMLMVIIGLRVVSMMCLTYRATVWELLRWNWIRWNIGGL